MQSGPLTTVSPAGLGCCGDVEVTLAPIVVYSNKIFRACDDHKRPDAPLGLAIDLGSTTVAAFVVTLDRGQVCAGGAGLNQQTAFGADVISRLAAAQLGPEVAERAAVLALSSIVQAVDALHLSANARKRIRKAVIVGNCAMHHSAVARAGRHAGRAAVSTV